MAFDPKDWHDEPATDTPVNAAGLIDLEQRLSGYTDDEIAALAAIYAPLADAALTGTPIAPTPPPGDISSRLATTAFVDDAVGGGGGGGGDPVMTWTNFTYGGFWRAAPDDWFTGEAIVGGAYAIDPNGIVYLDGQVSPTGIAGSVPLGIGSSENLITTLPAGYEPATLKRFVVPGYDSHSEFFQFLIQVRANGEVRLANYYPFSSVGTTAAPAMDDDLELTLTGIHFRAA